MKQKQFFIAVVLALVGIDCGTALADNELRAVQLSGDAMATVVTLQFAGHPQWKLFTLDKPDRAVLDLRAAQLRTTLPTVKGNALVSKLRSGPQRGGGLRLVFDLTAPAHLSASLRGGTTRSPPQLVITLESLAAVPGIAAQNTTDALQRATDAARAGVAPAVSTAAVRASHAPRDSGRQIVIAVDAGHGGPDPGATGRGGTREKDVVLGIARALAARINRESGMRAVLTRDGDYFLTLRERIGKARAARADMFVSVHADSVRNPAVSGASVYVLSEKGATNEQARWLAERENAADLKGGVSLDDKDPALATVLLDLSQTASLSASLQAADRVIHALDGVGQVHKAQVLQAGFVVLKSPDIPSMLVETAYISNPQDERQLRRREHQALLADAIFSGVRGYFERNPPDGTRYARAENESRGTTALARGKR